MKVIRKRVKSHLFLEGAHKPMAIDPTFQAASTSTVKRHVSVRLVDIDKRLEVFTDLSWWITRLTRSALFFRFLQSLFTCAGSTDHNLLTYIFAQMVFSLLAEVQPEFYYLSYSNLKSMCRKTDPSKRQQCLEQLEIRLIANARH